MRLDYHQGLPQAVLASIVSHSPVSCSSSCCSPWCPPPTAPALPPRPQVLFCTLTGEQRTLYKGYLSSKELQVGGWVGGGGLEQGGKGDEFRLAPPCF